MRSTPESLLVYDARCNVIDSLAQSIAGSGRGLLRHEMVKIILIWQRWTSEDRFAHQPHVTFDWAGPMDLVPNDRWPDASLLCSAWEAVSAMVAIDTKAMS